MKKELKKKEEEHEMRKEEKGALSLGVQRPEREVDHSPHLVPRLRLRGAIPPLPQSVFMAWCLVKHRDNFTFTLPTNVKSALMCAVKFQVKF
jgi:hypothetical protein